LWSSFAADGMTLTVELLLALKKNGFVCHILGFVASALFCFAVVICFGCFLD